jgi:hypothetical protein
MRRFASIAIGGLVVAAAAAAFVVSASSAEEPPHTVVLSDGDFEIRDYPSLTIAEVTVHADRNAAAYAGFRKLAGYIFGGNAQKQKIEMTAPVIEARAEAADAEGGPQQAWTIRFVMPRGSTLAKMPKPDDQTIRMVDAPATRYAVLRFSGVAEDGSTEARTAELEALMKARGIGAAGAPLIAQYNPPWIPGFMRRNEIMIPIR